MTDDEGATGFGRRFTTLVDESPSAPAIQNTPGQPRAGESVYRSLSSDSPDIATYEWDVDGDGTYTSSEYPGQDTKFANPGTYTVWGRVRDTKGRTATTRRVIAVSPASGDRPAELGISGAAAARTGASNVYNFGASSLTGAAWAWDTDEDGQFDDAINSPSVLVAFASPGRHEIGLRLTQPGGLVAVQYKSVEVHSDNRPPALFVNTQGSIGGGITLRPNQSFVVRCSVLFSDDQVGSFAWDTDADGAFDDGTAVSTTISFPEPGLHRVYCKGTDAGGMSGTATLLVDVLADVANRAPTVEFQFPEADVRAGHTAALSWFPAIPMPSP